jgi:hypothetical protein
MPPHSNFDTQLKIKNGGKEVHVRGPLAADSDVVTVTVSATVTQEPVAEHNPKNAQQGASSAGETVPYTQGKVPTEWEFEATASGGEFRKGWAFASAEQTEQGADGAVEKYTWSQWVWLHHT